MSSPQPVINYIVPNNYGEIPMSSQDIHSTHHDALLTPPTVVKTEARKIIITSLSHKTTTPELRDLILKLLSKMRPSRSGDPYHHQHRHILLQDVEIARHPDHKSRGHAFAVFETHHVAKAMIKALDGLKFHNRQLSARFAKEGAEPSSKYSAPLLVAEYLATAAAATVGSELRYPLKSSSSSNTNREKSSMSGRHRSSKDDGTGASAGGRRAAAVSVTRTISTSSSTPHSHAHPRSFTETKPSRAGRDAGAEKKGGVGTKSNHCEKLRRWSGPLVVSSSGREHVS